jgi:hypothetical protein
MTSGLPSILPPGSLLPSVLSGSLLSSPTGTSCEPYPSNIKPEDLPLLADMYVLFTELQIALAATSNNNTLGCFNEIPLTYKLHCIKAIPKEDPKRAKKRDRDTEHDHNDFDKGTSPSTSDGLRQGQRNHQTAVSLQGLLHMWFNLHATPLHVSTCH